MKIQVFVFCLLVSMLCQAQNLPELDTAYVHLTNKQYDQAINTTQKLLDDLALNTIEEISLAHKILGVSKCQTGLTTKALSHFETLKTFTPDASLSGIDVSSSCKELFTTLHLTSNEKRSKRKKRKSYGTTTPAQDLEYASSTPVPKNRYLPFGVGQFKNGDTKKGWAFLIGQSVLYSGGAISLGMHASEENKSLRDAGLGMIVTGAFTSIWGVIDASRSYKKASK